LKDAHKNQDLSAIEAAMTDVNNTFQAASQDLYNAQQQQANAGQPQPDAGQANTGGKNASNEVTDVDFEEVK